MDMTPLRSDVLIKMQVKKEEQIGSLVIPESAQNVKYLTGEVLKIGHATTTVKVGDVVAYTRFTFKTRDGEFLVKEDDIIAVLEGT